MLDEILQKLKALEAENADLRRELSACQIKIGELEQENARLRSMLNRNSQNSSKPPSTDFLKKPNPKSLREKSGRTSGGQKGHPGKTLRQVDEPGEVQIHHPEKCSGCHSSLEGVPAYAFERRQVFEIPEPKLDVIEHRCGKKICPACGNQNIAEFPAGVDHPVQYGPRAKGLMAYLQNYQIIPYERISEFFEDIFGATISEGTIFNAAKIAYEILEPFEEHTKQLLAQSDTLHADESGVRVGKNLRWLHTASTATLTNYGIHEKRGQEGSGAIGILPNFKGTLVHDCWAPYFSLDIKHALCNAHLLRELNGVVENAKHAWASNMRQLLSDTNKAVAKSENGCLTGAQLESLSNEYRKIIELGIAETDGLGPVERTASRCLLERFILRDHQILLFAKEPNVPFDNNQAERDIRMVKVKQKVSGCFRSEQGAKQFARIRSYVSTVKKQGQTILEALQNVFLGNPFMPTG